MPEFPKYHFQQLRGMQIDKRTQAEKTRTEENVEREKKKRHRQINKHRQWQLESMGTWRERKERHR